MERKRKFREKTFNSRFNYLLNLYLLLDDGKWHTEKDIMHCQAAVDGILTRVTLKKALGIPSCGISYTLLERTTNWVERRKGKRGIEVRWVGAEPTAEMMSELTLILDDQKNGKRNRALEEAKKKEEVSVNEIPETTAETTGEETTEAEMTTVGEVLNDHLENQLPTSEEIGELFVEGLKGTYGDKFNNLFKQVRDMRKQQEENQKLLNKMYVIFCEIAGVKPE